MKCTYHPDVETNLRCNKCGKPICPKDMVQTPVGARCPECARLYKLPTFAVSREYYLRAIGTGLGIAIVLGLLWAIINSFVPFFFLNLLLGAGAGYAIGEIVGLSVNRKRGTGLAIVAAVAMVISYLARLVFISLLFGIPFLLALPLSPLSIILDLAAIGLGIYIAVIRIR